MEIWKDIKGFENLYEISNYGEVYSYRHKKFMKVHMDRNGYKKIGLRKNGSTKYYFIHRLIWETFNGIIPLGMVVNHINEVKTDNRLENLNLMTTKENNCWGTATERRSKKLYKPVLQFDIEGNFIKEWSSAKEIKEKLGFSQGTISSCCSGRYKQAYGYVWKLKNNV